MRREGLGDVSTSQRQTFATVEITAGDNAHMLMIIYSSVLMTRGGATDYRDRPAQLLLSLASGHHKAAAARHWQASQILHHDRFFCWQKCSNNFFLLQISDLHPPIYERPLRKSRSGDDRSEC